MQVIVQKDQAEDVAEERASNAAKKITMQIIDLCQGHEVFRNHQDSKANGLKLQIAPLLKHHQR